MTFEVEFVDRALVGAFARVLEQAGLGRNLRVGRESLFELEPNALAVARRQLEDISAQWDDALGRLKTFVEK